MAWNTGVGYTSASAITAALLNGIGNDLRTWGGDVDGGGYTLANLGTLRTNNLNTASGAVITINAAASVYSARKGHLFGTNAGNLTALAATDACIQLYYASANNWAGLGVDGSGNLFLRTGLSGTPDARLVILNGGLVGVGTTAPTVSSSGKVHFSGDTARIVDASRTPANSAATGNDGEVCVDSSYVYLHSGGSWRRASLATF